MTARADKVAELHAQLEAAVEHLVTGDDWRAMLDTSAKFHRYSANNVMLIMMQCPDATSVAGYRTWQRLGRQVRKGEKGIAVLAPCRYKLSDEETGSELWVLRGFKAEYVFDLAQTDGDDLPDVLPQLLEGEAPAGLWDVLAAQVKAAGFTLERGECVGTANGTTHFDVRTVRVRDDVSDAQACKTLAHELGHVLLNHGSQLGGCRGRVEVEAESVAYIVSAAMALPTDGYSLPYVGHWANGDVKVVRETAERVITTARTILDALAAAESEEAAA